MGKAWILGAAGMTALLAAPTLAGARQEPALPPERTAIVLRVAGDGLPHCRSYRPDGSEAPCLPRLALRRGSAINGWHRDGEIAFSQAAATRLSDHEFALLAGHEIAHWYLGHRASTRATEQAADRLGAQLACRAGYDVAAAATLFRHLRPGPHHPAPTERRAAVLAAGCAGGG